MDPERVFKGDLEVKSVVLCGEFGRCLGTELYSEHVYFIHGCWKYVRNVRRISRT